MSNPPSASSFKVLSDAEREASLRNTMKSWDKNTDVWVFGYGSLIWRPEFNYAERREALLRGYFRSLCLWSHINRGTPENPGLVFGLDNGGSCRGIAFRISANQVPQTMENLWQREMPGGAYVPKWLNCQTPQGLVKALVFTMDRSTDAYVRDLPPERLVSVVRRAHGYNGSCLDYVLETAQALTLHNIKDQRLSDIVAHLHCPILQNVA